MSEWTGTSPAHCGAALCHCTFTGVTVFDRHRRGGYCLDPVGLGMVRNERGLWGMPNDVYDFAANRPFRRG